MEVTRTIAVDRVCTVRKVSVVFETIRSVLGPRRLFTMHSVPSGTEIRVPPDVTDDEATAVLAAVNGVLKRKKKVGKL